MTAAPRVLLTISGSVNRLVDSGAVGAVRRTDFLEMQRILGFSLLDEDEAVAFSLLARLVGRLAGGHAALAIAAFAKRDQYDVIVTDAEHTGLPLAMLLRFVPRRACKHVMVSHVLSSRRKPLLVRTLGLTRSIDHFVVYAESQRRFAIDRLGIDEHRVTRVNFAIDERFFSNRDESGEPLIASVGVEGRDYATLLKAVDGLEVGVVIAASSNWASVSGDALTMLPANVHLSSHLSPQELRDLYNRSIIVVVPLIENPFQAGVTTILEGMAMGRAVVYSRTKGQTDVVLDGETGIGVSPGDVGELRLAIEQLLSDVDGRQRLGQNARQAIEESFTMDRYVRAIGQVVEEVVA